MYFLESELRSLFGEDKDASKWDPFVNATYIGNVALTKLAPGVLAKVSFAGFRERESRYTGIEISVITSAGVCDRQFFSFEEVMGRITRVETSDWKTEPYIEHTRSTGEMKWKPENITQDHKDKLRDAVVMYLTHFAALSF